MASDSTVTMNRSVLVIGAIVLVTAGAGGGWLISHLSTPTIPNNGALAGTAAIPNAGPSGEVTIMLTKEAAERAGVLVTTVTPALEATSFRIPASVQPNAYKTVSVTPLTSGRVTRIAAEL